MAGDIKGKIVNFDIKPVTPIIPQLLQRAIVAIEHKEYVAAEKLLRKVLAINKVNYDAIVAASTLYTQLNYKHAAVHLLERAYAIILLIHISPCN